jgi:hypothetical protein
VPSSAAKETTADPDPKIIVEGRWSKGRKVRKEADLDMGFAQGHFGEVGWCRFPLLLRVTFQLFDLRLSTADFRIRANPVMRSTVSWLLATGIVLAGCFGPLGPIPGGRLQGGVIRKPVTDWSFATAYRYAQVETRPKRPYSVTVNYYVAGGNLYLDIGTEADWNRWRRFIREDPRVRVRFGQRVYELLAVPVFDRDELSKLVPVYFAKAGVPAPRGCNPARITPACIPAGVTFARLDPRPPQR